MPIETVMCRKSYSPRSTLVGVHQCLEFGFAFRLGWGRWLQPGHGRQGQAQAEHGGGTDAGTDMLRERMRRAATSVYRPTDSPPQVAIQRCSP